jgi:hypothetical protein
MPAPVDAFRAGVHGDVALGVNQVQLAMFPTRIGIDQGPDDVGRRHTLRKPRQGTQAIQRVDQGLRR